MKKTIRPRRAADTARLAHSVMADVIKITNQPSAKRSASPLCVMVFQKTPTTICFRQVGGQGFQLEIEGVLATTQVPLGKVRNDHPS